MRIVHPGIVADPVEKKRISDVIDYDLEGRPGRPELLVPERVELSKMFGSIDKRLWRRR